ncbi:MAG: histidinol dehydrogenase [Chitinophagales bacterium]
MKLYIKPKSKELQKILQRPSMDYSDLEDKVSQILEEVKAKGEESVIRFTELFDGVILDTLQVSTAEFEAAEQQVAEDLKQAIQTAKSNIERFHQSQKTASIEVIETMEGIRCWRKSVGIQKVGLYIPGGTAPLFSTVLMLGIPAKIAECEEVILCSPPRKDGTLHPAILYAAKLVGISKVFKVGGVQAIAAMAYGTESIPAVYKIFGPGNQYVTLAKQLVTKEGIAIDMPAGPSEVMVVADETAVAAFVAADLLSQAEHGADSQVVLVAFEEELVRNVQFEINRQLEVLPRKDIAAKALQNSLAIIAEDREAALEMVNEYAPEHLIVSLQNARDFAEKVVNAGSVFIGNYSPESVGDYASGTNHTLPTNGFAKAFSGVSLDSFVKKITFQELTPKGLQNIAATVETMALAEELMGHQKAVEIRRIG